MSNRHQALGVIQKVRSENHFAKLNYSHYFFHAYWFIQIEYFLEISFPKRIWCAKTKWKTIFLVIVPMSMKLLESEILLLPKPSQRHNSNQTLKWSLDHKKKKWFIMCSVLMNYIGLILEEIPSIFRVVGLPYFRWIFYSGKKSGSVPFFGKQFLIWRYKKSIYVMKMISERMQL